MTPCPECHSKEVYRHRTDVYAAGGHGPNLLPGLVGWLAWPEFLPVVCGDCGYVRFFASESTRANLESSQNWKRV